MKKLLIILSLAVFTACSGDDDKLSCTTNGQIDDSCETAIVKRYSLSENYEFIEISIGGNLITLNSFFTIGGTTTFKAIEPGTTFTYGEGYTYISQGIINRTDHFEITIKKMDRTAGLISASFKFSGEGAANYQGFPMDFEGKFTDVSFFL